MTDGSADNIAAYRWVAPQEAEIHWENWGGQYAVFDARSGDTHLLSEPTARLLQLLVRSPGTASEITEALCREAGEQRETHSQADTEVLLQQLYNVGLIEKAGA